MQSMTGFGAGSAEGACGTIQVQISAVNHRNCQVHLRGDLRDLALEDQVRTQVRDRLQRGSITVQITVHTAAGHSMDVAGIADTWRQLKALADELDAPVPRLESLVSMHKGSAAPDSSDLPAVLDSALDAALTAIGHMRATEGLAMKQVLSERVVQLETLYHSMCERAPLRLPAAADALRKRLQLALEEGVSEDIIARECAVQADRIDASEELDRLASHFEQFRQICDDNSAVHGKRLEFLLQEIHREVNTTGSKSNDTELTNSVLTAKNIVDQLKEQSANIV